MIKAEIVSVLKEGYWERTAVVRLPDGELRVRKESRGDRADDRPWARRALVREIEFMRSLDGEVARLFPGFIESWDNGYDMEFLEGWRDVGSLIGEGMRYYDEAAVAEAVIGTLHREQTGAERLSAHVMESAALACDRLAADPSFASLVEADEIIINGSPVPGLRRSLAGFTARGIPALLDHSPQVRLHGDLILENIIVPEDDAEGRFKLIDPVSVAGVTIGHPAFDLVKYQSYASGELYAVRSGAMVGRALSGTEFSLAPEATDATLRSLEAAELGGAFRARYVERYGEPDPEMIRLLDGYFSLAMAINTTGSQPLTRALKAAVCLTNSGSETQIERL